MDQETMQLQINFLQPDVQEFVHSLCSGRQVRRY